MITAFHADLYTLLIYLFINHKLLPNAVLKIMHYIQCIRAVRSVRFEDKSLCPALPPSLPPSLSYQSPTAAHLTDILEAQPLIPEPLSSSDWLRAEIQFPTSVRNCSVRQPKLFSQTKLQSSGVLTSTLRSAHTHTPQH